MQGSHMRGAPGARAAAATLGQLSPCPPAQLHGLAKFEEGAQSSHPNHVSITDNMILFDNNTTVRKRYSTLCVFFSGPGSCPRATAAMTQLSFVACTQRPTSRGVRLIRRETVLRDSGTVSANSLASCGTMPTSRRSAVVHLPRGEMNVGDNGRASRC